MAIGNGVMGEKPCNDAVEDEDGIDVGSRLREREESISLLLRLIRCAVASVTTDLP